MIRTTGGTRRSEIVEHIKAAGPDAFGSSFFLSQRLLSVLYGDEFTDPYVQEGYIYANIQAIERNLAQTRFQAVVGEGDDVRPSGPDSPLQQLLDRPNQLMGQSTFLSVATTQRYTTGGSYWVLFDSKRNPVSSPNELPAEMWPFPSTSIAAIPEDQGSIHLRGWELKQGSGKVELELHQVIAIRFVSHQNPHEDLAPMAAAQTSASALFHGDQLNAGAMKNGAEPGIVISVLDSLTRAEKAEILNEWEERFGSSGDTGKPVVVGNGSTIHRTMDSRRDMQFVQVANQGERKIRAIFAVPKFEVGLDEDVNRTTAEASKSKLFETRIIPDQRLITTEFNPFAKRWGREVTRFDNSGIEALRQGFEDKITQVESLRKQGYTLNQANEKVGLGMPDLEGDLGDSHLVMTGWELLEDVVAGIKSGPDGSDTFAPLLSAPKGLARSEKLVARTGLTRDEYWRAVNTSTLAPAESQFRAKTSKIFMGLRGEVLSNLKRLTKFAAPETTRAIDVVQIEQVLFDEAEAADLMVRAFQPTYEKIISQAIDAIALELGELKVIKPDAKELLDVIAKREFRVKTVVGNFRTQLRRIIAKQVSGGASVEDLRKAIRSKFGTMTGKKENHALTIARTEAGAAYNTVRDEALRMEGIQRHEWVTERDENVRDSHRIDGEERPVGSLFSNGLAHPHDPSADASEVINCFLPGTLVSGRVLVASKARYSGPAREIYTARGHRLRVTSNHPILTDQGWVAAKDIAEGERLVACVNHVEPGMLRNVDHENGPSPVEDVFQSLLPNGAVRLPVVRGLDLHGEAGLVDGHIDIVGSDRSLLCDLVSRGAECIGDIGLVLADHHESTLSGLSAENFGFNGVAASTACVPSCTTLALDEFAVAADGGPLKTLRLGPAANWHPAFAKSALKRASADAALFGELLEANPGAVSVDQVVSVRDFEFAGHVYDLQSPFGWIVSENIVSSNCRCVTVAVIKDEDDEE